MNKPIIPAETACDFNTRVSTQINSRLFLFCNYEPTVSYGTDSEAKYVIAIQDLYKFAIDSNYVLKHYREFLLWEQGEDFDHKEHEFELLGDILRNIENLRAVFDHNQSENNGWLERERLEWYRQWLKTALNKAEPENSEDFALLYQKLEEMAKQLLKQVDRFLQCIERQSELDREALAKEWFNRTLSWYTHSMKTDIYMGQLMNAYIVNAEARGKSGSELHESAKIRLKTKKWIENALRFDCERDKKEIERIKRYIAVLKRAAPDQVAQWERGCGQSYQQLKDRLTGLKNRLAEKQGALNSLNSAVKYFFDHLEDRLRETANRLDREGRPYTLLPQDLMQEDIDFYFDGVSSPDGDF